MATTRRTVIACCSSGRHVPAVTIVVDSPGRTRPAFDIIDELTREHGLVTSETIPALQASTGGRRRGGLRLASITCEAEDGRHGRQRAGCGGRAGAAARRAAHSLS